MAKSLNNDNKTATTAHLVSTVANELAHVHTHHTERMKATDATNRKFHDEHIDKHLVSAIEHTQKLHDHIKDNYPKEHKAIDELEKVRPETYMASVITKAANRGRGN